MITNDRQWASDDRPANTDSPVIVRALAHFFSYVFHPLFIPLYVTYFLTFVHPSYFAGFAPQQKTWLLIRVAYIMIFFPLLTVLLLKGLGFINSILLKTQKDRIIPYIACGIFFFWSYQVFKNQHQIPLILTSFSFAVFLSSSAALMANIYFKISMHAIGMGGVIGLFLVIMQQNTMLMTVPLTVALLITGIVCTARLLISNHTNKEIYIGLLMGIVCQFIAAAINL
ncbi:hypothetical protein LK994_04100 [Ferruginibacter lapsinanis]|uniref:DNA translocase FtsK 4TM domain-containing protein n=1 Tax=Ferruginibacter lapsinanis TaxID=563172 RepID=UPI001E2F2D23|nr:DNA translocase FtsK 4TM domain-containing protein [Ferruginibacter lapsinanis]UEG50653.1 hypothetical protein LK994_04100 [Ferruginibacter lapsinanis]